MTNNSGANHPNAEAFRQGQRDREQGWPDLSRLWEFTGWQLHCYEQGYQHPRIDCPLPPQRTS